VGDFLSSTGAARKGHDVVAIYGGASSPTNLLACDSYDGSNDNSPGSIPDLSHATGAALSTPVNAGNRYWVQVSGTNGQAATGELYLQAQDLIPLLQQTTFHGKVQLDLFSSPLQTGKVVYFFRKSGITGHVVPLGIATVDSQGVATRIFNSKTGQILALYAKVVGAHNIVSPYSNTVTFKVK
jgi:hypothetical protein